MAKIKKMKNHLILTLLCFASILSAKEYTIKTVPNPRFADAANSVSNPDGILSAHTTVQINEILQSLENDTKAEIAVVALKSIGFEEIESFGVALFEEWGIGKKDLDNGLLILLVEEQRAIRFEVGYGLEGILPDALCKRIQTTAMLPEFKRGDYDAGMLAGVQQAAAIIREEPLPEQNELYVLSFMHIFLPIIGCIFVIFIIILFVSEKRLVKQISNDNLLINNQIRYEKYVTNNNQQLKYSIGCLPPVISFLFMFIGAFFGGIASMIIIGVCLLLPFSFLTLIPAYFYRRNWKRKFRRQPFACSECGNEMRLLSEKEDNKYLQPSEDKEDELKSVDADVFLCNNCEHTEIFKYDNKSSKYKRCAHCRTKAFYLQNTQTITKPTYLYSGLAKETYVCAFCNYTQTKSKRLPKLTASSGSSGGSGSSSGGGSFGGGHSGGGGSTSRW